MLTCRFTGCSVIKGDKFKECHPFVSPNKFYEACVHETCLCYKGGDCGCFCAAVASYARACNQAGKSILWREEGFCGKSYIYKKIAMTTKNNNERGDF